MDQTHVKRRGVRILEGIFFLAALLFSFWLMIHTFSYDTKNSSMLIGAKAYSDFGAHIPLIRSFSFGDNLARLVRGTVEYPIYPGEPIRYHFVFYMIVGALERLGLRIDWALNIPSALGFFALMTLLYLTAKRLFHSAGVGILTVIFFLFNGSFAFIRFFQLHPLSPQSVTDIISNNIFPCFAPWGVGDISAFWNMNIYTNQRHLAGAFALALLYIGALLWMERKPFAKQAVFIIPEIIILAVMPYFHQPVLVILAIFTACYFILFPRLRLSLILIGETAALCILPQILPLLRGVHTIRWNPGYLVLPPVTPLHILWYWTQNIGLHILLIPIGWLLAPVRIKKIMAPLFFVFLIPNLYQFSVEMAANHKFFNFYVVFGGMLSAYVIVSAFRAIQKLHSFILRIVAYELLVLCTFSLIFSGIIDFFPVYNDGRMPFLDMPKNAVAAWIRRHTPPDAVFLNSGYGYQPESIAGRKIVHGWPYSTWSAGYDAQQRDIDMKTLFETTDLTVFCHLIKRYNISYVSYQIPFDLPDITPSLSALTSHARRIYADEKFSIWVPLCQ